MNPMDRIKELSRNSIAGIGDTARIKMAMTKAVREKNVCIGFIGGSITQGASASSNENRYVDLTAQWWRTKFPDAEIKTINAGIGATGSLIGVHRIQKDLLQYEPDFVVVEYSVNDENIPLTGLVYEGLLRRILLSANMPGVMLVFMTNNAGHDAQEIHKRIGSHYDLPMVSFRDAMWPEVQEGRIKWNDIEADEVHPNDCGHEILSRFITDRLDEIYDDLNAGRITDISDKIAEPLISDQYIDASIIGNQDIKPVSIDGWEESKTLIFKSGWVARKPSGSIVFEVFAKSIGVIYKKYNTCNIGRAEVRVDDMEPVMLEGHFPCYWGGYAHGEIIANNLTGAFHRVEIKFLEEHDPDSTGDEFMICGLLIA